MFISLMQTFLTGQTLRGPCILMLTQSGSFWHFLPLCHLFYSKRLQKIFMYFWNIFSYLLNFWTLLSYIVFSIFTLFTVYINILKHILELRLFLNIDQFKDINHILWLHDWEFAGQREFSYDDISHLIVFQQ